MLDALRYIDNRIGKYSANGLRTNTQRMTSNIPVGEIEKLLLPGVVLFLLSATEE
jgi:hypothetical protein